MPADTLIKADLAREGLCFGEILQESLGCAVLAVDARLRIRACNPAAEVFRPASAPEWLGQSAALLPPPLPEWLGQVVESGRPVQGQPATLPGPQGQALSARISIMPLLEAAGERGGAVVVVNYLEPTANLEETARRWEELASIGTLSVSLAHEIKNALVPLKTFLELLLAKNADAELATLASKEMRRLDALVSQMLRFAGPAKPAFAPLRMHKLLERSLLTLQYQLESKHITLRRNWSAKPDVVLGDPYQLAQAVINLLLNALEAMEPGGMVTVTTDLVGAPTTSGPAPAPSQPGPQLSIAIQDSGSGIAPENLERLFEPFFTTKPKGTGLGLAITRRIIQNHNGAIAVQSELQRGATFTILLPLLAKV
jgi:signal transduction histidine kinase